MKEACHLVVFKGSARAAMRKFTAMPNVVRVTNHGPHLKVIVQGKFRCPEGMLSEKVRDQTTHVDVKYWDFAMQIARRAIKTGRSPQQAIDIVTHYLCNLFVLPEPELFEFLAAGRRFVNASVTDEEAHGWELPVAQRLRAKLK